MVTVTGQLQEGSLSSLVKFGGSRCLLAHSLLPPSVFFLCGILILRIATYFIFHENNFVLVF